jgi:hypothetical protein
VALTLLVASATSLVSCSGGGGGGGGATLSFSADKSSVSFDYQQGQPPPPPQMVTITASGQYTGTLYIAATISGPEIATPIPITVTGTTATVQIGVALGLTQGTYAGTITLKACSDSACAKQVGNSVTIAYSITVRPPFVALTQLSLDAVSGAPASQVLTVNLPQGETTFSAGVLAGNPWLTVTNVTSSSFTISAASLPSGSYSGTVQVTSGTQSAMITVTYTVTAPSGGDKPLAATPTSLTLATVEDSTTSAMLTVTPPSWNPQVTVTVEYPSGAPTGWLTLTPVTGGETVLASAATLSAGTYTANIRLHAAYPATDILVPVALTVGVGLVRPADVSLTVNAETTQAGLLSSVIVNVVSGPVTSWSAASSIPWLVLTPTSGQTGQSLAFQVDSTQLAALPNGQVSTAQVTITPALTSMTPVSFKVTLNKNLPQIQSLAPYAQLASQPVRVILRGSGFSAIASPVARFAIDGVSPTSVSLVGDTEVVAQFAALAAGAHSVSVSNALGIATATGRVVALTMPAYSYTAIPTSGSLRSLAYDPERDALYGADVNAESVMSFRHSGGSADSWTTASMLLASAYDVGLTQDGARLIATSSAVAGLTATGSIEVLDPASLTLLQSTSLTTGFLPTFSTLGFGIPTTNDGRSWLATTTDGTWGTIAYITSQSLTPTAVTVPSSLSSSVTLYGGPWYAMSRDGERLIITQSAAVSPQPPMLYMNAADSVLKINPAGLTFSYNFSLSDTGDRVLFDNLTLRDSSFNLIGPATLPVLSPSYYAQKGVVSPDGTRVYVLAYRSDAGTTSGVTPRVFVFDATTAQANLPVLGYFDVTDYPGCVPNTTGTCSGPSIAAAISLDGRTLFFAGNQNLIIMPVPATLTSIPAAAKGQRRVTPSVPWPLSVHY